MGRRVYIRLTSKTAVKPDNFSFVVSTIPRFFEPMLAELPPIDVREPVVVDGVEYPVVISQPILHGSSWKDKRSEFANSTIYLNNFAYGITPISCSSCIN